MPRLTVSDGSETLVRAVALTAIVSATGCRIVPRIGARPPDPGVERVGEPFAVPCSRTERGPTTLDLDLHHGAFQLEAADQPALFEIFAHRRGEVQEPSFDLDEETGTLHVSSPRSFVDGLFSDGEPFDWQATWRCTEPLRLNARVREGSAVLDLGGLDWVGARLEVGDGSLRWLASSPCVPRAGRRLELVATVAEVRLQDLGNVGAEEVVIEAGVGELLVDLHGDWRQPAVVRVDAGLSDVILCVPHDLPCELSISPREEDVSPGSSFDRVDGEWINAARRTSPTRVRVEVDVGLGSLTVRER